MKVNLKNKLSLGIAGLALTIFAFSNCKGKSGSETLRVAGSDTMVQMMQVMSKEYMKANPDKKVSVQGGGSGTGIAALINDSTDIANASRRMKRKEWKLINDKGMQVTEHVVALDMLAVIVNPINEVSKLTIEQLSDIYNGKITNWKEVGGADAPILAISRENNSGTHVYFKEKVVRKGDKESEAEYGKTITFAVSSQQLIDQIKTNENAIAYVGMGWLTADVKPVKVKNDSNDNYFLPAKENSGKGKYPLGRTLQIYVNEKAAEKYSPFLKFISSEAGKVVVKELGFIPGM